jgi:hypothetical protein
MGKAPSQREHHHHCEKRGYHRWVNSKKSTTKVPRRQPMNARSAMALSPGVYGRSPVTGREFQRKYTNPVKAVMTTITVTVVAAARIP